jgi:hypothetical protein
MAKPATRERALQKLDALGVGGKIFEGHGIFSVSLNRLDLISLVIAWMRKKTLIESYWIRFAASMKLVRTKKFPHLCVKFLAAFVSQILRLLNHLPTSGF